MGRPLKKDSFGTEVLGTPATTNAGITVSFYDGANLQTDGIIIKQRGARTFVVARIGSPETRYTCVTQSGTPSAEGQMQLVGFALQGQSADNGPVALRKISRRQAIDFNGNRYSWKLENDSSTDYIALTAF